MVSFHWFLPLQLPQILHYFTHIYLACQGFVHYLKHSSKSSLGCTECRTGWIWWDRKGFTGQNSEGWWWDITTVLMDFGFFYPVFFYRDRNATWRKPLSLSLWTNKWELELVSDCRNSILHSLTLCIRCPLKITHRCIQSMVLRDTYSYPRTLKIYQWHPYHELEENRKSLLQGKT